MSYKYKENIIDISLKATEAYKKYYSDNVAIREAMVLKELYPALFVPMAEDDTFAGTLGEHFGSMNPFDFSPKKFNQIGYSIVIETLLELAEAYPHRKDDVQYLLDYWREESTFVKIIKKMPKEIFDYFHPRGVAFDKHGYRRVDTDAYASGKSDSPQVGKGSMSGSFDTRIAGIVPDFDKLMRIGVLGLKREIEKFGAENADKNDFYTAAKICIDILLACIERCEKEAFELAERVDDPCKKENILKTAKALSNLKTNAPKTLREGMQLLVIYSAVTHTDGYGRMDVYFGDLLANDLKSGELTYDTAVDLTGELWKVFNKTCGKWDARVIIGGLGRRNVDNADKFALVAMDASRKIHDILPALTLRLYKGIKQEIIEKALDTISEGCSYPALYNDDVYVEGAMKAMNATYEDALNYSPLGCGEMLMDHLSTGSPNTTMRFIKILEAALHNGRDAVDNVQIGLDVGSVEDFETYEDVENALFKEIRYALENDVKIQIMNKRLSAEETAFIMQSLLFDGCIEKGLDIMHGGIKYFGANIEGFGLTNTANSMAIIKKYVYDDKKMTLRELVSILDTDYEGHEDLADEFMHTRKFGNNDAEVDEIKRRIEKYINDTAREIGAETELDYYTVANVNPGGIVLGPSVAATADGRRCGEPFALANAPAPGTDTSGLAAMLISTANSDPANGGIVTNMHISRETITEHREQFKDMLGIYFNMGGLQLNINCVGRGELEDAMVHPEKYPNLIVRVSGFSARFVQLDKVFQEQIAKRTLF